MVKRALLTSASLNTAEIDGAVARAAAQMIDEMAAAMVIEARSRAKELGLAPQGAGQALAAALGRFCAESSSNSAHLLTLISAATATMDGVARGHYNDRIEGQQLIRGLPGMELKRV